MSDSVVELRVNGMRRRTSARTVGRLLAELGYSANAKGVAVARNAAILPRGRWEEEPLANGDEIDIVGAVQGG